VSLRPTLRRLWLALAPRSFLRRASPDREELGRAGEELAARALLATGWRVDGRRIRTPHGEVDLWVRCRDRSLVVEVKTRRLSLVPGAKGAPYAWDLRWRPARSLGERQRQRLERAAHHLERCSGRPHTLTLVEVFVSRDGRHVQVQAPERLRAPEYDRDWESPGGDCWQPR